MSRRTATARPTTQASGKTSRRVSAATEVAAIATDGPVQVVWLKRDLRVADHAALHHAAAAGPVVALYVFEPAVLAASTVDRGQYGFVLECLAELDAALRRLGAFLCVRRGEVREVLATLDDELRAAGGIAAVHAHEETGELVTYERDLAVGRWLGERGVPWHEYPQHGVVRRLGSRDGWSRLWQQRMQMPTWSAPERLTSALPIPKRTALPTLDELGLPPSTVHERQRGGRAEGLALLQSFLCERGESYRTAMSSPLAGWQACSRLSTHFAWGTVSVREAYQALARRTAEVRALPPKQRGGWLGALSSFGGRLRWHCHFMQKLEDAPRLEIDNVNRAFDGLREHEWDEARYAAWCEGRTGYPMVDACMRCLRATGWLNFRMRAMLVSFAAHHLWLHWRRVGEHLARCFVDYEPGIHWSQVQMQSGVTGINTVRIYSPKKQLLDQDPDGVFVRRWVPELARVPLTKLAEPATMDDDEQAAAGCRIGVDYPAPIVDHDVAVKAAKARIYALRRTAEARAESREVLAKHGSRKRPGRRAASKRTSPRNSAPA